MTGRRALTVLSALACLLAAASGCVNRKGFIIGADLKLEFNRVPWRTGPHGQYEVDCPGDCAERPDGATCPHLPGRAGPRAKCTAEGCPPAPLPGDCGLPPAHPHPRSRFHPLPMHDVLRGPAPLSPPHAPGETGETIREEPLPELVTPPPTKALEKASPEEQGKPAKTDAPFELEETDEAPPAQAKRPNTWTSIRSRSSAAPLARGVRPRATPRAEGDGE